MSLTRPDGQERSGRSGGYRSGRPPEPIEALNLGLDQLEAIEEMPARYQLALLLAVCVRQVRTKARLGYQRLTGAMGHAPDGWSRRCSGVNIDDSLAMVSRARVIEALTHLMGPRQKSRPPFAENRKLNRTS